MMTKMNFGLCVMLSFLFPCYLSAHTYFYVDPDYNGAIKDGSDAHPWSSFGNSEWSVVDNALSSDEVIIYFSAREAGSDTNEINTSQVTIYRNNNSTNRVCLDGMSKYNTDDTNPSWTDYSGSCRHQIMAGYTMSTGQVKRNYVTIRGFKIIAGVGGYGGQIIYYWGGDHVIIEYNDLSHDPDVAHGAALQFGYAHQQGGGGNGGCTDIIIRNNIVHDTYGEGIYLGGSEDTGLPAHSNILVENNIVYNCGIYGGQGDCIDPKDEITGLVIRNNYCHHGYGESNVNGIPSSSSIVAEGNIIHDMPDKGISVGTYWGSGFSGTVIKNNLIYNNGTDGIYLGTDSATKPIDDTKILNNTVFDNGGSGIVVGSGGGGISNLVMTNNIIMSNDRGISGWGSATYTFSYNDVYDNNTNYVSPFTDMTGIDGNISEDPLFINSSNADFHLQEGSPAIDAGDSLPEVDIDLDGNSRPRGAGWDIGVFEYIQNGEDYLVNVYPNPCRVYQGENSVTFFGDLSIGDNIKIFDMSGKIVYNSGNLSEATYEWNVGEIASGIYFFVVKSADGDTKASGKIALIR